MKLAIYETVHLDWVLPLCELFNMRNDEVHFLTNISFEKDIRETLGEDFDRFHWRFMNPECSQPEFYKELKHFFSSQLFDCILLNSVEARHLLVVAALNSFQGKLILNVHDINNFFRPTFHLYPKKMLRYWGKRRLQQRIDAYIVNAEAMKEYMLAQRLTKQPIFWIPPVIEKAASCSISARSLITITIPGSIDEKRRDYKTALKVFSQLHAVYPRRFSLVLAGRPVGEYGSEIIEQLKKLKQQGLHIVYSETEIDEATFQYLIASSHLLLSPLIKTTSIHDNIAEEYGKTKVSGNTYDAIRHGKPMIVPSHLTLPKEIISSCPVYSSTEELLTLLEKCIVQSEFMNELLDKAYLNSKEFSKEATGEKLGELLEHVTNC